jgi:hypothetical protein
LDEKSFRPIGDQASQMGKYKQMPKCH